MMETDKNRRRHSRVDTRNELTYAVLNSAVVEASNPRRHDKKGLVMDSSDTGVGFMTSDQLEPGNHIQLKISGAWRTGVVMWTAVMWKVDSESEYRVGVHFLDTGETPHEAARGPKDGTWTRV